MRILHCIPSLTSGGAERQAVYLAGEQVRQGHTVDVAFVHGGPNLERLQKTGARLHLIRALNNHDPTIFSRLVCLVRACKPDVLQTWLTQMDILGGLAAILCGVPWVLSERSSVLSYPLTLKNRARNFIGKHAQAIVANSAGGTEYWRVRTGPKTVLCQITNPSPIEEIAATAPASDEELRVEPNQKVILVVGRLALEKNLPALIDAVALAAQRAAFVVRICGEGDTRTVTRLIESRGLSTRIVLVGFVSRVWAWMKRADLFVSVSHFEGQPNAVLEAALCGCPLLLSDIRSHREVFDENSAAFVDPNDARLIADAIVRCLEPDVGRSERIERARERARGLSLTEVEGRYLDLYEKIAAEAA